MYTHIGHDDDPVACLKILRRLASKFSQTGSRILEAGHPRSRQWHPVVVAPPGACVMISDGRNDLCVVQSWSSSHRACMRHDADGSRLDNNQVALHEHAMQRHLGGIGGQPQILRVVRRSELGQAGSAVSAASELARRRGRRRFSSRRAQQLANPDSTGRAALPAPGGPVRTPTGRRLAHRCRCQLH